MPAYGRRPSPPDERDYRLAEYLAPVTAVAQLWGIGPILDQGQTPTCVGHGGADWGNCLPVADDYGEADAQALYRECKAIDGDSDDGSTVRSLAKALKARDKLTKYAFGSLAEARAFILTSGPVVLGIDWYEGMERPTARGIVHPTGDVVGGHCVLAFGADTEYCHIQNSWGAAWGLGGCCRMSWDELAEVFAGGGEAMAALELPLTPAPTPPAPQADLVKAAIAAVIALLRQAIRALQRLL